MASPAFKSVAIVGGTGVLGSAVASNLESIGFNVYRVLRNTREPSVFSEENTDYKEFKNVVEKPIKIFDVVILANRKRNYSEKSDLDFSVENFLQRSTNSNTLVVNLASYIENYQIPTSSENFHYQQEKIKQSCMLRNMATEIPFKLLNLHLFTVYGQADENGSFVSQVLRAANLHERFPCTDGNQLISLTHITDFLACIRAILVEESFSIQTEYSFWPTPPITLSKVVSEISLLNKNELNVDFGAIKYKGHEIFEYNPEIFPEQIFPNFRFLSLREGIRKCLDSES
jgi:nucleoside-diphosphate-sugar epimerase